MSNNRPLPDPRLRALARLTRVLVAKRGAPSRADASLAAGFEERHIPDILLAISAKTISNYANHLFHTPLDAMFERRSWNAPA